MRHKIIWRHNWIGPYSGHRDAPADPRPTEIEADKTIILQKGGNQPIGIQFVKGDVIVATFFDLPQAVLVIDDVS